MSANKVCKSLLLASGYLIYLLAGAAMFQVLEQGAEEKVKSHTKRHRLSFLGNYTCIPKDAMDHLIQVITEAVRQGINPLGTENQTSHTNWDFSSSFFFAGTVVTTIGYGTLAPRTAWGQIFCVVYALFGIPLNLIVLGDVSKTLTHWCKDLWKYLFHRGMEKKKAKIVTIVFFLVTGIVVFLGIPPLVFTATEDWSYHEGVYYAFISLSTIGFGDYVAGLNTKKPYTPYRAFFFIWIIFGLAWIALLFNLLTFLLKDTEKKIEKDLQRKAKHRKLNQEISMEIIKHHELVEEVSTMITSKDAQAEPRDNANKLDL